MSEEMSSSIKWTEKRMQFALTGEGQLFDFRRYSVVPNVSWGLLEYEVDLLCLSRNGVFHDVEIKTSKADMASDLKKRRFHNDHRVGRLWYAYPKYLLDSVIELVPEWAGIVVVAVYLHDKKFKYLSKVVCRPRPKRRPVVNAQRNPTNDEIQKFLQLGVMRMWSNRSERMEALDLKELNERENETD